mgnify:CR=1 FL=1
MEQTFWCPNPYNKIKIIVIVETATPGSRCGCFVYKSWKKKFNRTVGLLETKLRKRNLIELLF